VTDYRKKETFWSDHLNPFEYLLKSRQETESRGQTASRSAGIFKAYHSSERSRVMKCIQKFGIAVALAVFGIAMAAGSVFAADLAELVALADKIKNENPGIQLTLATDKNEYQMGEKVAFEFTADKDCYLALIDIGTSGKTIILFPNKWHTENKIEKGKAYKIPADGADFAYRVEGPAGTERVKAIACLEPLLFSVQSLQEELKTPLKENLQSRDVFLSMKNAEQVLKDIGIVMAKADPTKWSTLELQFKVASAATPQAPAAAQPPAATPQAAPPAPAAQPAPQPGQAQPQPAPAPDKK